MLLIGGKMVAPEIPWPTQCTPENPAQLTLNRKCYRVRDTGKGEGALAEVAHTIHGNVATPQTLIKGAGPAGREYLVIKNWNRGAVKSPPRLASAHLVVGYDGHIVSPMDLVVNASYSVGTYPRGSTKLADSVNGWTISIELCQTDASKGWRLYEATVAAGASILNWLADRFSIPKVYPGNPNTHAWLSTKFARAALLNTRGIFGHCNVMNADRGPGDPGKFIFDRLHNEYGWTPVIPKTA